jgi:hypothetical protein
MDQLSYLNLKYPFKHVNIFFNLQTLDLEQAPEEFTLITKNVL